MLFRSAMKLLPPVSVAMTLLPPVSVAMTLLPPHTYTACTVSKNFIFFMAQQTVVDRCLLIIKASRSHPKQTTVGRTPPDERSARRRDLYLTTHNTHNRQTSMPPVGLELAIPASERLKTHALDRTANGIGIRIKCNSHLTAGI